MDREEIARGQRRRQVEEILEEERNREAALAQELEEMVAEDEGPRIDARVFARMDPREVALLREVLAEPSVFEDTGEDAAFVAEEGDEPDDHGLNAEIARLQTEIADSRRRQLAYRRYLEALDS